MTLEIRPIRPEEFEAYERSNVAAFSGSLSDEELEDDRTIAEHDELAGSEAALEREIDLLRHQVHEIDAAHLRADEEEETVTRYHTASNGKRPNPLH